MLQEHTNNMPFAHRQVLYLDLYLPCYLEMMHRYVRNLSCQSNISVLVHISEVGAVKREQPSSKFLTERYKAVLLLRTLSIFVFHACPFHTVSSVPCNRVVRYRKSADSWSLVCDIFLWLCHSPIWCPWSAVLLGVYRFLIFALLFT